MALLAHDDGLRAVVQEKLGLEWSPEQISARLRLEHPGHPGWHICHETIYQALYNPARGGLSRELTKKLRTGRPLRKRRRPPASARCGSWRPASSSPTGRRWWPAACASGTGRETSSWAATAVRP